MPLTIRLDPATANRLDRLVARRGATRSEVVREALNRLLQEEERTEEQSFYDEIAHVVGSADSGGMALSEQSGEKFRRLLEERRAGRSR